MANTALHSTRWPMCRCVAAVALWLAAAAAATDQAPAESFLRLMNRGKAHLDNGDAAEAIASFRKAVEIHPSQVQARLNLASACLFAGQADEAIEQATAVLDLDRGSAAAYYIAGCAHARASRWRQALRAFQQSKALQPGVSAVSFQIALAHRNLDHAEQAIQALRETVSLEPRHVSAHYMLGQLLARAGKREEAMKHLNIHEQIEATVGDLARDENTLQRCEHTRAVVPDHVVQPEVNGIDVRYRDVTEAALPGAGRLGGPVAAIDFERDGWTDLLVRRVGGLQRLQNHEGVFEPLGPAIDVDCGQMRACVVGDVDNDGFEDAVVAGANGAFLVRLGDGAEKVEVRRICQDDARRVLLVDLDHTGKLDLLLLLGDGRLRLLRNRGSGAFDEMTAETGLPTDAHGFAHAVAGDWNRDQTTDVLIARRTGSPLYFQNQLLGMVAPVAITPPLPSGTLIAANDVNNDLRLDAAVAGAGRVDLVFGGQSKRATVEVDGGAVRDLKLVDYDNDGWLDLLVGGDGVRGAIVACWVSPRRRKPPGWAKQPAKRCPRSCPRTTTTTATPTCWSRWRAAGCACWATTGAMRIASCV